jgi:hypothetical protein
MKKLSNILLLVCLVAGALGFSDVGSNIFSGFCRAMGAVFFILAFITRVIEKAEAER